MASMLEDFWEKLVKPLIDGISNKKDDDDFGMEVLEDGTLLLDKKEYNREDAIELKILHYDSGWVLLETKNYYVIKPKELVSKEDKAFMVK